MKKLILTLSFLLCVTLAFAQGANKDLLTQKKWVLKSDVMSGVGKHKSLPENTQIEFKATGRWVATEGIEGLKEGTWEQNKKGEITLMLGMKKKAKVTSLTANELKISMKDKANTRELVWGGEI